MLKMHSDIERLIESMMGQFKEMREDYTDQLKQIEGEFDRERETILASNERIINDLFIQHKEAEQKFTQER